MFYPSTNFSTFIFIIFPKPEMLKTNKILDFLIPLILLKSHPNQEYEEIRAVFIKITEHLPLSLHSKGYIMLSSDNPVFTFCKIRMSL